MFFCLIFGYLFCCVNSARILGIFPTPAYSHQIFGRTLMLQLESRGHHIVTMTANPIGKDTPKNYKEINLNFLYKLVNIRSLSNVYSVNRLLFMYDLFQKTEEWTKKIYAMKEVKDLIANEHFDLVILEWSSHASLTAFSKHFNCPLIGIRSLTLRVEAHDVVANPVTPSYLPVAFMDYSEDFVGRLINTAMVMSIRLMYKFLILPNVEKVKQKHFPHVQEHVSELERNVSIILTNSNPIINGVRPLVPSVIEIGGIHLQNKPSDISKELQTFLDESKKEVILFSFGTLVDINGLSPEKLNMILNTFSKLPYNVLLKLETIPLYLNDLNATNIRCYKWLPQRKILGHKNVKLFITHSGLNSVWESIENNVPIIGIPFHTDHFYLAHRLEYLGIGKQINIINLTEDSFFNLINEVISNKRYKEKTKEIWNLINDQIIPFREKAMWWVEYVLRHRGAPYFKSKAVDMHWFIYYSFDIILFITFFCFLFLYILYKTIKCIIFIKSLFRRKKDKTQ